MEHLKDIVKILKKKRVDKVELIDNELISTEESLLSKLYLGLVNDKFETDLDAMLHLYGKNDKKTSQNYRRLKSRLSRRIFNTLFFLDMNQYSIKEQYERISYELRRVIAIISILKRNGAREAAIKIVKDNYQTAQKYYLYDVLKIFDYELSIYYSLFYDKKNFEKFLNNFFVNQRNEILVQKATLLYYEQQLILNHKKGFSKLSFYDKRKLLEKYTNDLNKIREEVYSYETEYYFLRTSLSLYEICKDSKKLLETSESIISLTNQKNFRQEIWNGIAILYKVKALLLLKNYDSAIDIINKRLNLFNEGGINWFTALEFLFLHAIHSKKFEIAKETLTKVETHRSFKNKPDYLVQKWYIFKAYLILVTEELNSPVQKSQLKIARLYNDTLFYVNDKSGYFLAIRLLEMTELIRQNDFDTFSEKCGLLRRYRQQYMDKETHEREFVFTDMLLSLEKLQFSRKEAEARHQDNYLYLKENEKKLLINDFEIVPYDHLWEIILRYLTTH